MPEQNLNDIIENSESAYNPDEDNSELFFEKQVQKEVNRWKEWEHFNSDVSILRVKPGIDIQNYIPCKIRHIILDSYEENFNVDQFVNLEELSISYNYNGPLPNTSELKKLKVLSVSRECSWNEITGRDLTKIERLSICVRREDSPIGLICPNLKSLTIFFSTSAETTPNVGELDFSFLEKLEILHLNHAEAVDYRGLNSLHNLKELKIVDSELSNVDFLREMSSLTKLVLQGKIVDVTPLSYLANLEVLCLWGNQVTDASSLKRLPNLRELDLYRNPVSIDFDRSRIAFSRVTEEDKAVMDIKRRAEKTVEDAVQYCWFRQKKNIEEMPLWMRKKETEDRKLPFLERVKRMQQFQFQIGFGEISPLGIGSAPGLSPIQQHEIYIEYALKRYPYLSVTEDMQKTMEIEKIPLCDKYQKRSEQVSILKGAVVIIQISIIEGDGEVDVKGDISSLDGKELAKRICSNWNCLIEDSIEEYNTEINIRFLYKSLLNSRDDYVTSLSWNCLLSIYACLTQEDIIARAILIAEFKEDGTLKRMSANRKEVRLAKLNGAENIICYGTKKTYTDMEYVAFEVNFVCCKNVIDIQEALTTHTTYDNLKNAFEEF